MYIVFPTRICILGQPFDHDVAENPGRERRAARRAKGWLELLLAPRLPATAELVDAARNALACGALGSMWVLPREERDSCPWKSLLSQRCHLLQPRAGLGCCIPFCCSITSRLAEAQRKRHEEPALDKSKSSEEEGQSSREGRLFFLVYFPRR